MNKKIRCMVDEIFADMKMTAENLALRDELMANALARYEDSISAGRTEEDAFAEVAASLEDVRATLDEMNGVDETEVVIEVTAEEEPRQNENDIGEAFEKAFGAIGDFGKKIIPQVGKIAQQADEATGGAISGFGKAVGKGAVEVGRVAGETFEKISKNISDSVKKKELTADELMERAREIRIQAEIKQEADDQEGARDLRRKAYEMEMQAEALIQAEQIRKAQEEAAQADAAEDPEEAVETAEASADVAEEADRILEEVENVEKAENEREGIHLGNAQKDVVIINRFDAATVRRVEIGLDSDDVELLTTADSAVEVKWASGSTESTQPEIAVNGGVLTISRKNPDVFKTFFSVFKKEGGKVTVSVPAGLLLSYKVSTTSGDITAYGLDVEEGRFNSTSGRIRVETDDRQVTGTVSANTVSGGIEVRTVSESISATTVTGKLTVEGRSDRLCANTVSGKIRVNGAFNDCMADSVSGDTSIVCAAVPQNRVKISTVSGSARLVLPADIGGFKVEASSISGGVLNDFGPNRYGTCALPIRFDSMSGKLAIVKSVS